MKNTKRILAVVLIVLMLATSMPIGVVQAKTAEIPKDAVKFDGHYYYLYPGGTTSSWEDAKKYCESLGGYLAVISSGKENTFLYNYILSQDTTTAYFGFSDAEKEGTWKWVSNEKSTYTNWHSGEPNSESWNENYACFYWKFDDGSWNDGNFINGSDPNAFICEWNPQTEKITFSSPTGKVKSVFMYGFDKSNEPYSEYQKYKDQIKAWTSFGMTSTVYNLPTVEDFKTAFLDSNYIGIIEHGVYDTSRTSSLFCVLGDEVDSKGEKYKDDLNAKRLLTGTHDDEDCYIITPAFIEHYYGGNKLKGAVVFLFCCEGFGANGTANSSLAKAFEKCGASVTIGFYNEVAEAYAFSFYQSFTESMLCGKKAEDAYNNAIKVYGNNDYEYMVNFGSSLQYWNTPDPRTSESIQQWLSKDENKKNPGTAKFYGQKVKRLDLIDAPTNFKVKARTETALKLSWDAVDGAQGYIIYQYDVSAKEFKKIAATKKTSYKVKGLEAGKGYSFEVKAYKVVNKQKVYNNSRVVLLAMTKPSAPVLKAESRKTAVRLSWNKVKGATGYVIYMSTSKNGTYNKLGSTKRLAYAAKNLSSGKTYYFKIRAYGKLNGEVVYSGFSAVKKVITKKA